MLKSDSEDSDDSKRVKRQIKSMLPNITASDNESSASISSDSESDDESSTTSSDDSANTRKSKTTKNKISQLLRNVKLVSKRNNPIEKYNAELKNTEVLNKTAPHDKDGIKGLVNDNSNGAVTRESNDEKNGNGLLTCIISHINNT